METSASIVPRPYNNSFSKLVELTTIKFLATRVRSNPGFVKSLVETNELYCYTCERRQVFSKTKQHCHFIDEDTGKVTHFEIDNLDFLKGKLPGSIESFSIEVRGRTK